MKRACVDRLTESLSKGKGIERHSSITHKKVLQAPNARPNNSEGLLNGKGSIHILQPSPRRWGEER